MYIQGVSISRMYYNNSERCACVWVLAMYRWPHNWAHSVYQDRVHGEAEALSAALVCKGVVWPSIYQDKANVYWLCMSRGSCSKHQSWASSNYGDGSTIPALWWFLSTEDNSLSGKGHSSYSMTQSKDRCTGPHQKTCPFMGPLSDFLQYWWQTIVWDGDPPELRVPWPYISACSCNVWEDNQVNRRTVLLSSAMLICIYSGQAYCQQRQHCSWHSKMCWPVPGVCFSGSLCGHSIHKIFVFL